jgi:2-dehydro-3-deoxyphosphogluconate aldolase/(4S)-4-hydroxy-2-oxoglutarate aldolase
LKELKGPFPQLELLPTGGVSVENISEWFRGGAFAVAVGSAITKYAKDKNYDKVNERAKEFLRAIN